MNRKLLNQLRKWNSNTKKKPLILQGPKNVGKTYLVLDFIKDSFDYNIYMNFEHNPTFCDFFNEPNPDTLLSLIKKHFHIQDTLSSYVIVLDEVDYCPNIVSNILSFAFYNKEIPFILITSNCVFCEKYNVIKNAIILNLFPMDFEEFLNALAHEWYIAVIKDHFQSNKKLPPIVHQELLTLFGTYMKVGGMPEAVNEYINTQMLGNIPEKHQIIKNHQLSYAKQTLSDGEYLKLVHTYNALDIPLTKKNRKFQYKQIRKGATKKQYEMAIQYLEEQKFIIPVSKLLAKREEGASKFYFFDSGMLSSQISSSNRQIIDMDGLLENIIAQHLYSQSCEFYYWEAKSQAKLSFVLKNEDFYIPIEVKTDLTTRSRCLSRFKEDYGISYGIKISPGPFEYKNNIKYVPIYAIFCI